MPHTKEGEPFDNFITDIRILSKNCNYCEQCYPGILRDCIFAGVRNDLLHKKLLAEQKLILDKAIRICRASENADQGIETLADGSQQSMGEIAWLQGKIKV